MAQVSINLTNYKVTAPHEVFEECKRQAAELNIAVAGSELVGLIPLEAMLLAADYYIKKENLFIIDEDQKIKLVIDRLGLNSVAEFEPQVMNRLPDSLSVNLSKVFPPVHQLPAAVLLLPLLPQSVPGLVLWLLSLLTVCASSSILIRKCGKLFRRFILPLRI